MSTFSIVFTLLAFGLPLLAFIIKLLLFYGFNPFRRKYAENMVFDEEYVFDFEPIAPIRRSKCYLRIYTLRTLIDYLLFEYDLLYEDALVAVIKDTQPPEFDGKNFETYLDWVLLKKLMIDCETAWYSLIRDFQDLQTDMEQISAVKLSLTHLPLSTRSTIDNWSAINFIITESGFIRDVYKDGEAITLPKDIITKGINNTFQGSNYVPNLNVDDYPDFTIARAREEMQNRLMKTLRKFGPNEMPLHWGKLRLS